MPQCENEIIFWPMQTCFFILHYIFSVLLLVVVVDFFILELKDLFPKK